MDGDEEPEEKPKAQVVVEAPIKLKKPIEVKFPKRVPSVVIPKRVPVYITPDKTTCVECPCFPKESPYMKPPKIRECQLSPLTLYEYAALVVDSLPLPEAFKWSEADVAKWMEEVVGLPQYTDCIFNNRINGRRLLLLEDMKLLSMDVQIFEHMKIIVTAIHKLYSTEFVKFCRSIGLPPRKPLTHCTWFKSRTGPSWGIRKNWTRCDILRWMKILDPEPVRRDHWELVWYQKPDFPKTMFARIPPAAPREKIPHYTSPPPSPPCPEYKIPRKYIIDPLSGERQYIWAEPIVTITSKKRQAQDDIELFKRELGLEEHQTPTKRVPTPEKSKKKVWTAKDSRLVPKKICLEGLTGKDLILTRRLMPKPKFMKG
ncbi:unnamed protein product [Arctia plantaginis]|uniref:SAM domain-containing protein n=1 Tax=Arctia plantaginis TaxID=874455 RepID=A0A8S1BMN9_ARCPL|nr:unnamed protein product [Arctia plantaginis]